MGLEGDEEGDLATLCSVVPPSVAGSPPPIVYPPARSGLKNPNYWIQAPPLAESSDRKKTPSHSDGSRWVGMCGRCRGSPFTDKPASILCRHYADPGSERKARVGVCGSEQLIENDFLGFMIR